MPGIFNMAGPRSDIHALVIGAGIGGLLSARVLAEHVERVTIVERDHLPEGPAPRKGAPQARHKHVMLKRGMDTLERLLPGIRTELGAACAPLVDMANDFAWLTPFGWSVRFPSEMTMLSCSRDLLECTLRRRILTMPNVHLLEGTSVTGLIPGGECVGGVKIRRFVDESGGPSAETGAISADLVIDASGRFSRAPQWLEEIGYDPPTDNVVNGGVHYASRIYQIPAGFDPGWRGAYVQIAPPAHPRGGVLLPIEGGRWHLTIFGIAPDCPPTDERGFREFVRSLRDPVIYDAIRDAVPLTAISGYRSTENRNRRYDQLPRQPHNFLVLGDAACAFNPVYAQGMTTAVLGAEALERSLHELRVLEPGGSLDGLSGHFQRRLLQVTATPWAMATLQDRKIPGAASGAPSLKDLLVSRYMDRAVARSTESARVRLALLETMNMVKPPSTLFHPRLAREVLRSPRSGIRPSAGAESHRVSPEAS